MGNFLRKIDGPSEFRPPDTPTSLRLRADIEKLTEAAKEPPITLGKSAVGRSVKRFMKGEARKFVEHIKKPPPKAIDPRVAKQTVWEQIKELYRKDFLREMGKSKEERIRDSVDLVRRFGPGPIGVTRILERLHPTIFQKGGLGKPIKFKKSQIERNASVVAMTEKNLGVIPKGPGPRVYGSFNPRTGKMQLVKSSRGRKVFGDVRHVPIHEILHRLFNDNRPDRFGSPSEVYKGLMEAGGQGEKFNSKVEEGNRKRRLSISDPLSFERWHGLNPQPAYAANINMIEIKRFEEKAVRAMTSDILAAARKSGATKTKAIDLYPPPRKYYDTPASKRRHTIFARNSAERGLPVDWRYGDPKSPTLRSQLIKKWQIWRQKSKTKSTFRDWEKEWNKDFMGWVKGKERRGSIASYQKEASGRGKVYRRLGSLQKEMRPGVPTHKLPTFHHEVERILSVGSGRRTSAQKKFIHSLVTEFDLEKRVYTHEPTGETFGPEESELRDIRR